MTTAVFYVTPAERGMLMRLDLMEFIIRCFVELNPAIPMSDAPHIRVLASHIADAMLGFGSKRLIICLPPRSLKSISVSVAAVAWILGRDPAKQIICASYGQDLADKHARDTRTIMNSSFYRRLFPATRLSPPRSAVNDFATTKQGFRMATSVGGVLTGRGGDILIIDDPLKPDEALSETKRTAVNEWYDNTLLSRLNNKEQGIVIIVMQRLHQDDLVGHVLGKGDHWDVISFPAIAVEEQTHTVQTVWGPYSYKRERDDVIDSSRESLATLRAVKANIGTYTFESQYQQDPAPAGGAVIKREWLHYYEAPLPAFSITFQSWDTANKASELNDYSVCTTWGIHDGHYYLIDVFRAKLEYPDLKRMAITLQKKHNAHKVVIEDKASGTQLIQELRHEISGRIDHYDPPSKSDKTMRVYAQTSLFEAGKVLFPSSAPWLAELERELLSFPGAKFDDQVDSVVQALDYATRSLAGISTWVTLGKERRSAQ